MVIKQKIAHSPRISLIALVAILLIAISAVLISTKNSSFAQTTNNCYASLSMYSSSGTTGMITGIAKVSVGLNTAIPEQPVRVTILLNGREVGQARPEQTSSYHWIMLLPTNLLDPSSTGYELKAMLKYAGFECITPPVTTPPVMPTTATMFMIQPNTPMVEIPVNTQAVVSANVVMPEATTNYSMYSLYAWSSESRGAVNNTLDKQTTYFSGPEPGDGRIRVRVKYGYRESEAFIPTRVLPTNSPIQQPTSTQTTNQTPGTNATDTSTTDSQDATQATDDSISGQQQTSVVIQPVASIENDSLTKECAEMALGSERFTTINSGQARPTLVELEKLKACFARTNYIIPSNFAPVAPKEIENLPKSSVIKITEVKNEKKQVADTLKDVIKLSGKAAPNSTVIIYVFSEPLVLTTTADSNGEWVYELENPLESGDHTMYAVVDRGDGVYEKTDPLKFAIGTAEASAENPAGLSLILNEEETAKDSIVTTVLYISSTLVLLGAIAVVVLIAYKKGKSSNHDIPEIATMSNESQPIVGNNPIVVTPNNIQPLQTNVPQQEAMTSEGSVGTDTIQNPQTPNVIAEPQVTPQTQNNEEQ